jgi:hypothetical protein
MGLGQPRYIFARTLRFKVPGSGFKVCRVLLTLYFVLPDFINTATTICPLLLPTTPSLYSLALKKKIAVSIRGLLIPSPLKFRLFDCNKKAVFV